MRAYVQGLLVSFGLAVVLLLASSSLSGSYTVRWNGAPCVAGTQYGLPLPFFYSMNRHTLLAPQTHSTAVCPTTANVVPLSANPSYLALDYAFWFLVSLPIVFGVMYLYGERVNVEVSEKDESSPVPGFEPPLPTDPRES